MTDREIANRLLGREAPQQGINQVARQLVAAGRVVRRQRQDGKIGNYPACGADISRLSTESTGETVSSGFQSEDDVKRGLQAWLEANGWKVTVVWGRGQGIDMEALRGNARWIIEVKGQGTLSAMRVNYFLSILGELL